MSRYRAGRPIWLAGPDGVAHVRQRGLPWAWCGTPAIRERDAWPETSRCGDCLAADLWPVVRRALTTPTLASRASEAVDPGVISAAGRTPLAGVRAPTGGSRR